LRLGASELIVKLVNNETMFDAAHDARAHADRRGCSDSIINAFVAADADVGLQPVRKQALKLIGYVFVAGATGVLGRALVPQLVAREHQVVGMTRSASKQDQLRDLGARPAVADALDADAVAQAVASAEPEVIVHQLTALSGKLSAIRGCTAVRGAELRGARWARTGGPVLGCIARGGLVDWIKSPRRIPRWLGRLAAGEMATLMLTGARGAANEKAKRELGWQLRYPSCGRASQRTRLSAPRRPASNERWVP
jgi:hypothetical protein